MSIFSELVTPITPVGAGSRGSAMANGLGDAAEFVETLRRNRAAEAHLAEQDRLKEQHNLSTDRYYDSMSKYHNALVEEQGASRKQKDLEQKQKQLQVLLDQHSKQAAAGDINGMAATRQAIEGLNLATVSDEESAFQPAAAKAPATPGATPSLTPAAPGTWSTLKNGQDEPHAPGYGEGEPGLVNSYMKNQGAAGMSSALGGASGSTALTDMGIGKDLPALTLLPTPQDIKAPAGPEKQKGRYVVKDKTTGAILSDFDAPAVQEKNRAAVAAIIAPMAEGGTPEANAAWKQVGKSAEQAVQTQGITPQEAVDRASKDAGLQLGQYKKVYPGAHSGGAALAGSLSKSEVSRLGGAEKDVLANIKNVVSADKYQALITSARELSHGKSLLASGNGFAERSAIIAWVKGMNGRGSAQEYKTIIGSGSHWHNLMTAIQKFEDGAPLSAEFVEHARLAMEEVQHNLDEEVNAAAEKAGEQIQDSLIPFKGEERTQQVARAKKFFKPSTPSAAPTAGGEHEPTPDEVSAFLAKRKKK